MSFESTSHWYVAHTHPRAEATAAAHLRRQGFNVYLPRYLKRRRHARRVDMVAAPLFPRYLFVQIDMGTQRWRAVQSTIGVAQLVCNGETPTILNDRIIEGLKQREDAGFVCLDQRSSFRSGDKIRVLDGAFADALGLFEEIADNDRVIILLDLLGRKVKVRLGLESVVAA